MAASMSSPPARIALSFDNLNVENCWFVVDFSKHSVIEDIENDIKKKYFKTSDDSRIVLRINNFRLPARESCVLLRDNDIVSVSEEKSCRSLDICESDIHITNARKDKKRKYEDVDVTDKHTDCSQDHNLDHDVEPRKSKKKKKKRIKGLENVTDDTNNSNANYYETVKDCEPVDVASLKCASPKKLKKVSKEETSISNTEMCNEDKEEDANTGVAMMEDYSVSKNSLTELQSDLDERNVDTVIDAQNMKKSSRKRHRKRKRKRRSQDDLLEKVDKSEDRILDTIAPNVAYKGRDVDKDEIFYGSLPDKLESPNYYRHGYRNLQSYQVESNKHKKFESDSGSDEEFQENTEQYNFLCKKREKLTAQAELSMTDSVATSDSSVVIKGHENGTAECPKVSCFSTCNGNNDYVNPSSSSQNYVHSPMRTNHSEELNNERSEELINISNVNDAKSRTNDVETGSPLVRKTLSNGVSVFVRQRSPRNNFRVQTKGEQLNTSNTNISTIFKNPNPTEFKVPVSPAAKHVTMLHTHVEKMAAPSTDECTWMNKEVSTFPLLQSCPKLGDIIAYKVLEISMNLTPEVSSYKVAKVISIGQNEMLELKNLKHSETGSQNDKFHIHMETDDEILTNIEDSGLALLHNSSLLETRILNQTS